MPTFYFEIHNDLGTHECAFVHGLSAAAVIEDFLAVPRPSLRKATLYLAVWSSLDARHLGWPPDSAAIYAFPGPS